MSRGRGRKPRICQSPSCDVGVGPSRRLHWWSDPMLIERQAEERPVILVDFSFSMTTVESSESPQFLVLAKLERARFWGRTEVLAIVVLLLSALNCISPMISGSWENLLLETEGFVQVSGVINLRRRGSVAHTCPCCNLPAPGTSKSRRFACRRRSVHTDRCFHCGAALTW